MSQIQQNIWFESYKHTGQWDVCGRGQERMEAASVECVYTLEVQENPLSNTESPEARKSKDG